MDPILLVLAPIWGGLVLGVLYLLWHVALEWWRNRRPCRIGCCSNCRGTGADGTPYSNGLCWDCYGTGHAHV